MEFIELGEQRVAASKNRLERTFSDWEIDFVSPKTVTNESRLYRVLYVRS
jgi:hypothetical protein